jgi:hypothetical protein
MKAKTGVGGRSSEPYKTVRISKSEVQEIPNVILLKSPSKMICIHAHESGVHVVQYPSIYRS